MGNSLLVLIQKRETKQEYTARNLEMAKKTAIGIDLGTTYSCVGVFQHGKVKDCSHVFGKTFFPRVCKRFPLKKFLRETKIWNKFFIENHLSNNFSGLGHGLNLLMIKRP